MCTKYKWQFAPRFRRHAFGWKSQPAIKRVKEAVSEIKKVARMDGAMVAEGRRSRYWRIWSPCAQYTSMLLFLLCCDLWCFLRFVS